MAGLGKKGLGRGFEALIPQDFDNTVLLSQDERVQKIAVDKIVPNPDQPRQSFDEAALQELAESVRQHGVLLPLVVTASGGTYHIVAGERRWRAAKIAKLATVPAIVRTLKEIEQLEISLIENVQRVDLSPLEQAVSIERLHGQFNMSYEQIAKRLGKASSTISNTVRLLQLPAEAQKMLNEKTISEGHARSLLALKDEPKLQEQLLHGIAENGWSVRQAERFVTSVKQGTKDVTATKARVATETPATKQLGKRLGTQVHVRRTAHGGKLEISFKDDAELDKIIALIRK
ncbi:MAG TPA: ParB/RepB/Spo0J family partition protein [Candidatus Saccharimonadales bacterium]|nr:ParB/RepB/Spo0J family partition protein [Candidatus Saccharimonadales bacterium]